ncbi:hypothetical protein BDZ94DRAFT_1247023 [Collybia nuda]|uniref:Uncharacterized protein n=1 Tax=Collybia nuda TaxID=64659 RepID=A0A9P6CJ42_9AGAR|nr:hypothetical protein BDZ94DRAFT_1247023 [Collybia nuda]
MTANVGSASVQLAERFDVHKSCKSLETLLNILNDYCEAAGAVVLLQKKLAKALRETAGLKVTGEIAANAMSASATIFEASSDIDSKYAKIVDKEYDGVSAEVKKWFKKLAKEEKLHDDKMANANARIKQAGQVYEKKFKKNARDATEEHARYINLISSLGPEISQEKYNHALNVTQRHSSTIYSTAACLSRIADAGWLRACEGVRRFSPTIGQLGEWRALCEGGWVGPVPQDLPNPDEVQQLQPNHEARIEIRHEINNEAPITLRNVEPQETFQVIEHVRPPRAHPSPAETEKPQDYPSPNRDLPHLLHANRLSQETPSPNQEQSLSMGPSSFEPPRLFVDANTGSVRSLSAFPSPPTHYPIPPPRQQQSSQSQSSQGSSSQVNLPTIARLTESPLPNDTDDGMEISGSIQPQQDSQSPSIPAPHLPKRSQQEKYLVTDIPDVVHNQLGQNTTQSIPTQPQSPLFSVPISNQYQIEAPPKRYNAPDSQLQHNRGHRIDNESEFDVMKGRVAGTMKPQDVERSDTGGSSGSIVAAMRTRYSSAPGPSPPVSKDVPRLPLSVNDLATRYQPIDESLSRIKTSSTASHQLPRTSEDYRSQPPSTYTAPPLLDNEAARRRRQQLNDFSELELNAKKLELQERERDIQMRARELERDPVRLTNFRGGEEHTDINSRDTTNSLPQLQIRPRERRTSFRQRQPQSQPDPSPTSSPLSNNASRPQSQYSYSTNHLVPPSPNSTHPSHPYDSKSSSHSQSQYSASSQSSTQNKDDLPHAPYCGCESCSVSKYKVTQVSPQPHDLRPPAQPIMLRSVEKSKPGWIRRLSMPVGNAFNLESSKHSKGIGSIASTTGNHGRGRIFSLDGRKNTSTTTLRTGIQEDGRRSYDAAAIGNRSMTNLAGVGKR